MKTKTYRVEEKAVAEDIVEYKVSENGPSALGVALKAVFYPIFCVAIFIGFLAWIKAGAQEELKSSRFATPEQMYEVFKDANLNVKFYTTGEEARKGIDDIGSRSSFLLLLPEEQTYCQTEIEKYDRELCCKIRFVEDCMAKYFDLVQNPKKIKTYLADESNYNELLAEMQQACDYISSEIGIYVYFRHGEWDIIGFSSEGTEQHIKEYLRNLWYMMDFLKRYYEYADDYNSRSHYKTKILYCYSGVCAVQYRLHLSRLRMLSMVQLPYTAY